MKFKSFINESLMPDDFLYMISLIHIECQPFIKMMGMIDLSHGKFLYRGSRRKGFGKVSVRDDRMSLDTDPMIHKDLDDRFNKKFGWRARSNGLFATGSEAESEEYGDAHIIFPVGPFKFIWSKVIQDLYDHINRRHNQRHLISKNNKKMGGYHKDDNILIVHYMVQGMSKEEATKDYNNLLDELVGTYKSGNLKGAIESYNEIMFNCKAYYKVPKKYEKPIKGWFNLYGNDTPTLDKVDAMMEYIGWT